MFCLHHSTLYAYQAKANCKESSHANYSSSGTLLASQAETFLGNGLPVQVVTTTYDGPTPLQKQVVSTYDGYSNVIEKDESDFYNCTPTSSGTTCPIPSMTQGPFLRKTFTAFDQSLTYVTKIDGTLTTVNIVDYGYASSPATIAEDLAGKSAAPGHPLRLPPRKTSSPSFPRFPPHSATALLSQPHRVELPLGIPNTVV